MGSLHSVGSRQGIWIIVAGPDQFGVLVIGAHGVGEEVHLCAASQLVVLVGIFLCGQLQPSLVHVVVQVGVVPVLLPTIFLLRFWVLNEVDEWLLEQLVHGWSIHAPRFFFKTIQTISCCLV